MAQPILIRTLAGLGAALLLAGTALAQDPNAEKLDVDVSARQIAIESTFTGARIVVFGAIDNSRQRADGPRLYDIAVVIRGPVQSVVARRKSRVAGIWINTSAETFDDVPGYYAVLSSRPLEELTSAEVLKENGIGFANLRFTRPGPPLTKAEDEGFRAAVIRIKQDSGLFYAEEHAVRFIGASLFRTTVQLPANVPVGEYTAEIYLFRNAELVNRNSSNFFLHKEGFERLVTTAAFDYPLLYGIIAVIVAVAAGLAASAAFRRD